MANFTTSASNSANTNIKLNMTNSTATTPAQIHAAAQFASKQITVDFSEGTLNGRTLRNFAIIRTTERRDDNKFDTIASETLVNRNQLLVLLATKLTGRSPRAAKGLIFKSLEQALFVEVDGYGRPESRSTLRLRDEVANANRAYVLNIGRVDKAPSNRILAVSLDGNTILRIAGQTDAAICPDKQVNKSLLIGAGANAAGVYRNNNTLTSVNPIADFTKGINRANAGFSPKADSTEIVVSNVEFEGEDYNFVAQGIERKVAFFPGLVVLAQGMVALNEGVSFDFTAPFDHKEVVAVATVGEEIAEILAPAFLSYGSEITANGVVIYTHKKFTVVNLDCAIVPTLNEEGTAWTFAITGDMVAYSKTNVKVRDFGCKGMTHNNGTVVVEDNSWDLLFSSESMKTAEGLRTMYCQVNGAHRVGVDGSLIDVLGNVVTGSDIRRWFSLNGQVYTVQTPVHHTNVAEITKATGNKVTFSAPDANGIVIAEQRVFGIISNYLFNIELSSADEIAGYTQLDATGTAIQSLISPRYEAALTRKAVKGASKVSVLRHNGSDKFDFDAQAVTVKNVKAAGARFTQLLTELGNVKAALSAILNAGNESLRLVFEANNNTWIVTVPVKAFLVFGQFDQAGNAAFSANSINPVQLAVDFLTVAATGDVDAMRQEILDNNTAAEISKFVEIQMNKVTSDALRTHESFYAKAIADWRVPAYSTQGTGILPVVYVAPESPVFNNGRKSFVENEFAVLTRCPMPAAVVVAVQTTTFAMDANVICVNPLIMDVNHGDCDGDAISLTAPRTIGAPISVREAMEFNASVVSIGGYNESLRVSGELSTTLKAIAEVADIKAGNETAKKFSKKYTKITNTVNLTNWANAMVLVQEVYANHVSSAYDIAFNALQQFTARRAAGDVTFSNALAEAMGAYTRYEDEALCGYSDKTYKGMTAYLKGEGQSLFIQVVTSGMRFAKEGQADEFATAAYSTRIAAKRFKSTQVRKARARVASLALSVTKIPTTSLIIKAIAANCAQ